MINIRREATHDTLAVYEVNEQAFGGTAEANLVNAVRTREKKLISLVAVDGGKVVGHTLFSPMKVAGQPENRTVIGLGPLAVLPDHQKQGVGSKLVRTGLKECRHAGFGVVAVLGHPAYYPRFGFAPGIRYGIKCEYADAPPEAFMVLELKSGALETLKGCTLQYMPEFNGV
jgi:putative acetyltransferase